MALRIYHLPALVGDHGPSLARLECARGHKSISISETPHPFGFHADVTLWNPGESPLRMELRRIIWFIRILCTADVVHYNWGRTLFPDIRPRLNAWERGRSPLISRIYRLYGRVMARVELAVLRARGVRIVVTFQGDDARQVDQCRARGAVLAADAMPNDHFTPAEDAWKRRTIRRFDKYAHVIFALNPDLLWVLPAKARFLPYLHWKSGVTQAPAPASISTTSSHSLHIAHAPSNRAAKGTAALESAIATLRARGISIDYTLIEGMPHADCVAAMRGADLFVDQLLYGWYGGAAVESMSVGAPTIACMREEDLGWVPEQMRADFPIIHATPDTIAAVLEKYAGESRGQLPAISEKSRAFTARWHDPDSIVDQVLAAYRANCA